MCGVVRDGVVPGWYGIEAGQASVGDLFGWYVDHAVPPEVHARAAAAGASVHEVLEAEAASLAPGESGVLALDWWNGNRSVLVDADLSGLLVGMTMATTPAEIYRALLEATAFGTRVIVETLERAGVAVDEVVACGGLPERNRLLLQLSADITGRTWRVAASAQAPALGAAMHAAVAAGAGAGGYPDIGAAAARMAHLREEAYRPDPAAAPVYDALYAEYLRLHDLFGRGAIPTMKTVKAIRLEALRSRATGSEVAPAATS